MNAYAKLKSSPQQRKRRGAFLKCETCSTEFYVPPSRIKQASDQGSVIRYCSRSCRDRTGAKNPFYGKTHSEDSIRKMAAHPNRPKFARGQENPNFVRYGIDFKPLYAGRSLKDRLLDTVKACQGCGYDKILAIIQVHHVNRNRRDNRPDNLRMLCPTCHWVEHYLAKDGPYSDVKHLRLRELLAQRKQAKRAHR